ncbi:MAG: SpaA isopeptide-forming pilin-related protein [Actinomycetota bacterium]|jgi:hypothetical protein|nr:SpaA isopeptide-forming pilin-related protein [Actinomycetota bacterium]
MSRNRKLTIISVLLLALLLLSGAVAAMTKGGNQTPAGHTRPQGAEISVTARDQDDNGLAGVEITVIDDAGNRVDSKTTRSDGTIIVKLGAAAGNYRVIVPTTPTGYVDHSDTDGAFNGTPPCTDPHRCIRYSVNAQVTVTVSDLTTADSGQGYFEFTKIVYRDEQKTAVHPGKSDELIERPGADEKIVDPTANDPAIGQVS